MTKALYQSGYGRDTEVDFTDYWYTGAGGSCDLTGNETDAQLLNKNAGIYSNLSIGISANTVNAATVFTFRKNAAAGNQTISVGASSTGNFRDTTHTDTVASGDKTTLESKPGTGSTGVATLITASVTFLNTSSTDTITRLITTDFNSAPAASTTYYMHIAGFAASTTTEASAKCRQRKAGTFKNLCTNVNLNARTTTSTLRTRKNAANGAQSISIGASTTGFLEDTTNTDTVAAGDDFNYSLTTGTGTGGLQCQTEQIDFATTDGNCQITHAGNEQIASEPVTYFMNLGGEAHASLTTEAQADDYSGTAYTFSELTITVTANDITSASTLTLMNNTVATALTISITASTSGVFSDSSHTVNTTRADLLDLKLVAPSVAGTHSVNFRHTAIWAKQTTIAQTVFVEWEES